MAAMYTPWMKFPPQWNTFYTPSASHKKRVVFEYLSVSISVRYHIFNIYIWPINEVFEIYDIRKPAMPLQISIGSAQRHNGGQQSRARQYLWPVAANVRYHCKHIFNYMLVSAVCTHATMLAYCTCLTGNQFILLCHSQLLPYAGRVTAALPCGATYISS